MAALAGDDRAAARSLSRGSASRRISFASVSTRSWASASVREVFTAPGQDAFERSGREYDDQEELMWAAIERLPTYDRTRKGILKQVLEDGKVVREEVDFAHLGNQERKHLMDNILKVVDEDNEGIFEKVKIIPSKKKSIKILHDVSGIIKPSRMTLLLGPPGSGKTILLKALAGKLDKDLRILGLDICADILVGDEMRRGISGGQKKRLTTGEMLVGPAKVFYMDEISTGLDSSTTFQIIKYMKQMVHIMDVTMIISLLQPAPETFELFDDVILLSEGQVVYQGPRENILEFFESVGFKCPERKGVADFLQEVTSIKDQQQYWYKKDEPYRYVSVAEFVECFSSFHIGQKLFDELAVPYDKTKAHPAALVTEKYGISNMELFKASLSREWLLMKRNSFLYIFKIFQITVMSIITFTVFFRTEMKSGQLADGGKFYGALFFSLINVMFNGTAELALTVLRLPVFFKQRDALFYPAWAFSLPIWLLRIPLSLMESLIWIILTYYTIGFAPEASRFFRQLLAFFALHQMALSLFRFIAALGRTQVVANTLGTFTLLMVFVLGGFIIAKDDIKPWMIWGYYVSPMMYGQNAIAINEFLDKRWSSPNTDPRFPEPTVGKVLLSMRGMFLEDYMYWVCVAALFAFSILFNLCFIVALTYLKPFGDSKSIIPDEKNKKKKLASDGSQTSNNSSASAAPTAEGKEMSLRSKSEGNDMAENSMTRRGMVLPFTPLSLAFHHVNYYVDMPAEMKKTGIEETRLQLLRDVSGAFRPGVLTALVGVSGAGKTTLMDVLAGRKTGGYIEGSISISGYPKNQSTFARVSGYCEQNDIHSPHVTVYESIVYSAWLRLSPDVNKETRKMFVEEVMELIELNPLRDALVGLPGVDGLSTEQRKRLTIAVELVANPSIIFMDEPTSGLDARAAAIVMRTVRNTVDTGRTVVCTIHQPSIDIFEAFDEAVPGVPEIKEGYNPATWMLEVSTPAMEAQLNVDFAEIYANSDLYRSKQQDLMNLVGAMYSAVMFLGGTNTSAVQSVVAVERTVFYREKAAGMYSPLPYAFAQVAIETIYVAIQTFIYSLILYSMIGFHWGADTFFWFYFFVFMCFIYFTAYGMMLVALTPNYQIAAIVMSFFLSFWNLFSGFLIARTEIPIWWRWYYWASPVAWTIYGLVTSQVGNRNDPVEVPGFPNISVKEYLDRFLGFKYDFLGAVAGAHVGWAILFCLVFAYGIKYLNFQRR
ncbi:Pleiotropic drug resistance protein 2 [Sesamum angolense]|uniref:Pleiotropic drug resistance protein 2 n=1 Tax=Sesamum angolense TaxID=2727404 RepID=A0AAE1W2I4_9LAMI|nr:Pleiotropic drug resistance protein 2 [Sesamum angolense]